VTNIGKTAQLRVSDAGATGLNHEIEETYAVVLCVTDDGGLNDTAIVTVTVTDLNEYPQLSSLTLSIDENSARRTVVSGSRHTVWEEDRNDAHV